MKQTGGISLVILLADNDDVHFHVNKSPVLIFV
jgi:hypothetical protein